ncbi:MAG: carboxymuconolactone decarboxylase family protein [Actinomycetota bacterium]
MSTATLPGFPAPQGLNLPDPAALMALMARIEPVASPWAEFARALMTRGRLPADLRELAILRTAHIRQCPYIWTAHLAVARHLGLAEERIGASLGVVEPPYPLDSALLSAVDELLALGELTAPVRAAWLAVLGEDDLIELVLLCGQYSLIAMACRTFGLLPEASLDNVSHPGDLIPGH